MCLTSREQELPAEYPDHTGVPYVYHTEDEHPGVDKADAFRVLREKGTFAERLLVSDEDSDHVNYVCRELSVRAVRVT